MWPGNGQESVQERRIAGGTVAGRQTTAVLVPTSGWCYAPVAPSALVSSTPGRRGAAAGLRFVCGGAVPVVDGVDAGEPLRLGGVMG
jgi:hypothetical protein